MRIVCWPMEPCPNLGDSNTKPWPRSKRWLIGGLIPSRYATAFSSQRNALRIRASISWKPSTSPWSGTDCRAVSYWMRSSSSKDGRFCIAISYHSALTMEIGVAIGLVMVALVFANTWSLCRDVSNRGITALDSVPAPPVPDSAACEKRSRLVQDAPRCALYDGSRCPSAAWSAPLGGSGPPAIIVFSLALAARLDAYRKEVSDW